MSGLLTTAQAAEKLGVTRWRVNQLIQHGRLKATRVGQIFIINEQDLKAVENRKPGRPPAEANGSRQHAKKKGINK
jgi:excisionase family DNA binding protein